MAIQPEVTAGRSGGSRQRLLVLALAGVLLLLLAVLVLRPLLLGGQAAPVAAPAPAAGAAAATTTTVAQIINPSTSVAGPAGVTAKDPFRPAPGAVTTAATATTAAPTAAPTTTTAAGAGAGAGAGTVSASGTTAQREVALDDVSSKSGKRQVKVSVDGTSYTAAEGDTFADDFLVLDVGSACATFDSPSGRFTLCEGEAVLK
jgi:hypothetical protein